MVINYDCLASILEKAVDPCKSGALYATALEFVDQQTVVDTVEGCLSASNSPDWWLALLQSQGVGSHMISPVEMHVDCR